MRVWAKISAMHARDTRHAAFVIMVFQTGITFSVAAFAAVI